MDESCSERNSGALGALSKGSHLLHRNRKSSSQKAEDSEGKSTSQGTKKPRP